MQCIRRTLLSKHIDIDVFIILSLDFIIHIGQLETEINKREDACAASLAC